MIFLIRAATLSDLPRLNTISIESKSYWDYPKEYMEIWKDELTITQKDLNYKMVYCGESDEDIIGFYSLADYKNRFYLEHIFITPSMIKKGFGTKLLDHAVEVSVSVGEYDLYVMVDPNSRGFYDKYGAEFIEEIDSNIPGRKIPLYMLDCEKLIKKIDR